MHILFDSLSSQVQVHRRERIRMNTLLGAIQSEGWTYSYSRDPITSGQLHGCDVLAILTREQLNFKDATNPNANSDAFAYADSEIEAIDSFLGNGGGLLLISNHGPNPGTSGDKYGDTKYDRSSTRTISCSCSIASKNWPALRQGSSRLLVRLNHRAGAQRVAAPRELS